MDIKTIAGIIGLVITIGGLFVFQGTINSESRCIRS